MSHREEKTRGKTETIEVTEIIDSTELETWSLETGAKEVTHVTVLAVIYVMNVEMGDGTRDGTKGGTNGGMNLAIDEMTTPGMQEEVIEERNDGKNQGQDDIGMTNQVTEVIEVTATKNETGTYTVLTVLIIRDRVTLR